MVIEGARANKPDASLIKLLIRAFEVRDRVLNGEGTSINAFARREGMSGSYVTRHLRLSWLAPDIVRDILDGRHPPTLTANRLIASTLLPLEWSVQRTTLGWD